MKISSIIGASVIAAFAVTVLDAARQPAVQQPVANTPPSQAVALRATLDKYCVGCHNERAKVAGLALDKADVERVADQGAVWENVLRKLRTQEMPPPGRPRPDGATYHATAEWLEHELDAAATANPNPGVVPVHRLNRAEYANVIRDLLAVEIEDRLLPPADARDEEGFDNIASALSLSPMLMERYMASARAISRQAVGDPDAAPIVETIQIPATVNQKGRMSDDLPFESRGGIALRHTFPADGEYVVKVRLMKQIYSYIIGIGFPHQIDIRLDGQRVKVFTVGGEAKGRPAPATLVGNIVSDPEWEEYMHNADKGLDVRFTAKAGTRTLGISFLDSPFEVEGVLQKPQTGTDYNSSRDEHYDGYPSIESVEIGGPYNVTGVGDTPSRRRIFTCRPATAADEDACARTILTTIGRRAYRRPLAPEDVQTLLAFYSEGRKDKSFDAGIQRGIERILVDPEFLFRAERQQDPSRNARAYRVSDLELASRLSFFLWSSIPDDELLDLAVRGKLHEPVILRQQARRMLGDSRSRALVENFVNQWLKVRDMAGVTPDPDLFPQFNENLRRAFRKETEFFVANELREDHSVLSLLTANYTYVNEELAAYYGIPNVYGNHFRRVDLSDARRMGLLGHASVMTVTAYPNRTSPVLRGKWLLETILGSPPPAPPADVPALKEEKTVSEQLSMRERMEAHRKNPVCASCHARMDPLGFALENFDSIGQWRTATESGGRIDTASTLPTGVKFEGVEGLRSLLVDHGDEFVTTLSAKLMTYALGRRLEYFDRPAVRSITRGAAASDHRWSAIIMGIVESTPFQMRRSES